MTDWFIRLFKHVLSLHDLVEVLMIQFKKGDEEIMQILTKHGFDAEEISGQIKSKPVSVHVQNNPQQVLPTLVGRLRAKNLDDEVITHLLLNAGFTNEELDEIQDNKEESQ